MDKIEQFIKKNKGCPLTPAATKQLLVKFMEFMGKELPGMISEGSGTSLKSGSYIYNEETTKYYWVEDIPEDYTGNVLTFGDDNYITTQHYENGEPMSGASLSSNGVDKIDFINLTHSFNELDLTLKQIVDDAIIDNNYKGVPCSQAQWNVIKALLEKSLYLYYNLTSIIKIQTGLNDFVFGYVYSPTDLDMAECMHIYYNNSRLYIQYVEI